MSLATDPRYRSVSLQWENNEQTGTELVQIFARPSGGAWSLARSVAVGGASDQSASWDTALPLTAYDLAFRYVNGIVPAVGYESTNPDEWTAPTAAASKGSVTTTSSPVAWGAASVSGGSATLSWTSAQSSSSYLLEKSLDSGITWVTVAANIIGNSYVYPIPDGEVDTTVRFRLTAQRDAIVGPTAGTLDVYLGVSIGTPDLVYMVSTDGDLGLDVYATWHRSTPSDSVTFLQARAVKSFGAGTIDSPIAACSAPAAEDVGVQPDGYVPVTKISTGWTTDSNTPWALWVRAGVSTSGGGILWGAWVAVTTFAWARSADVPPNPTTTIGSISSSVTATQTVDAGFGPSHLRAGAILFDVGDPWSMMKPLTPTGTHSYLLNFPSTWHAKTLYLTGWTMQVNPTLTPEALNGALAIGPPRTAVGVVP